MAEEVGICEVGGEEKLTEINCVSDEIALSFSGPFCWPGASDSPSVYDAHEVRKAGIYLWTAPLLDGHLIYYVGETGRSFHVRLRQHYEELVAARYHVYSAVE